MRISDWSSDVCSSDLRPTLIACRTTIGYGAPKKGGTAATHGSPLGAEEVAGAREKLGWPHQPFEVPAPILESWREAGSRGGSDYSAWRKRLASSAERDEFARRMRGELPDGFAGAIDELQRQPSAEAPKHATRQSSQAAQIGRASCRAREGQHVEISVVAVSFKTNNTHKHNKTPT